MQYLNSTYTQRYNVRHRTRGHLFQGRYKALLVDGEAKGYFLTVSDYIHLNPVRTHRIRTLEDLLKDPWNSAGWVAGMRKGRPEWLRWERVYGELGYGNWRSPSRRGFREHLERRMSELEGQRADWRQIRRGWCLGSEGFVAQMKAKLEDLAESVREPESWAGVAMEEMEEQRAGRVIAEGKRRLGYAEGGVVGGEDRFLLAKLAREKAQVPVGWLARQFGLRTRGGMSYSIRQISKRLERDHCLQKRWQLLRVRD